jgi:HK97 family phage major capsid protein
MTNDEALKFDQHLVKAEQLEMMAKRQEKLEGIQKQQNEPAKRIVALETANGGKIEIAIPAMHRRGKLRAFKGPKAEENAFKCGRWLQATIYGDASARQWCNEHGIEIRVQTEGVNTAGGFVVPDVMERAIIDLREEYGVFRQYARVLPMSSDHSLIPRRTGGVEAFFIGETDAITASDKDWDQVELTAKKLGALTRMSTDLSEDAIMNIADDLANEMAYAFAAKEDACGFNGDGTSTYGGMVGILTKMGDGLHNGSNYEGTSPCVLWSAITLADELVTVMGMLPKYAQKRAKWYIHPIGKAGTFDAIQLAASGNRSVELAEGALPMFGGYPIVTSVDMPVLPVDQELCIILGDLSMSSTFGDRRGMTLRVSTERYIEYDQIAIQATERFCIVNHDIGDATNAGPMVGLRGNS